MTSFNYMRHPLTFPLIRPKRKLLLGHPSSVLGHFEIVCPHIRAIVCSTTRLRRSYSSVSVSFSCSAFRARN